jgi:hypothetical protein
MLLYRLTYNNEEHTASQLTHILYHLLFVVHVYAISNVETAC